MRWVGCGILSLLLALPVARAEDPPKTTEGKEKPSAAQQYQALQKEFTAKRQEIIATARKAKADEQEKLFEQFEAVGKDFAAKFFQLAEDNPKSPVAADALFWVVQNGAGSPAHKKAADKVQALITEVPVEDLARRLSGVRPTPEMLDAVLKRADKEEKSPKAADLVAWAATNGYFLPAGRKAITTLVTKYPDNPAIERVIPLLGRGVIPNGDQLLRQILQKADKPNVKAATAMALGQALASKTDTLGDQPAEADKVAAEAEKYLAMAAELYKDNSAQQKAAEQELKALRNLRVGKEAPEIQGPDLDGKEFKLSDYRGKVVLLDFWGNW